MAARRATIRDVARVSGVSVATASAALNGKGRVAPATRENIIQVAAELRYSASRTAKNLIAGRTGSLVLAISPMTSGVSAEGLQPEWDIEYYFRLLNGASARAFGRGFLLSMLPFHTSSRAFLSATDGLVLVDPLEEDPLLDEVVSAGVTCVTVGRNEREVNWVDNDFFAGTTAALQHLTAARPSYPALFLSETSSSYVRDELSAYLEWCMGAGLQPVILRAPGPRVDDAEPVISEALRSPDRRFDAVLANLDTLAHATERVARQLDLSVPEDLQILSLTDSRSLGFGLLQKSITALDLHPVRLGELAVDLLVEAVEGRAARRREFVPTSLIVRESTLADQPAAD